MVDSEADFAAEKRLKDEQMKNNSLKHQTNSTPIKNSLTLNNARHSTDSTNHNFMNLSTTSSVSSSTNNLASNNSQTASMDINLNMSASEMRKLISSRRNVKAECKNAPIDLRQKYEIIQQM